MKSAHTTKHRYSLRSAGIVITMVCLVLGFQMNAARRQRQAVLAIERAGGTVAYDFQCNNGKLVKQARPFGPTWVSRALGIDFFHRVDFVSLSGTSKPMWNKNGNPIMTHEPNHVVSDQMWVYLKRLANIRYLKLTATHISDDELRYLSALRELRELHLDSAPLDGSGLVHLRSLPHLRLLSLQHASITEEHVFLLKEFPSLRRVGLKEVNIRPAVINRLRSEMPGCTIEYSFVDRTRHNAEYKNRQDGPAG